MSMMDDLFFHIDRATMRAKNVEQVLDVLMLQDAITPRTREAIDVDLDAIKEHLRKISEMIADVGMADEAVWSN